MFGLDFKHVVDEETGEVKLEHYRYVDKYTGEIMCEMIDGNIVWYFDPPDPIIKCVIEEYAEHIMREWFLEYNGIISKHKIPEEMSARSPQDLSRIIANFEEKGYTYDLKMW